MWNVFENCWLLLTLAGVALITATLVRQEKPEWGYKPLLVPLLLIIPAFGLDYAFTTDYEAISAIVPTGKRAAIKADVNALMALAGGNYSDRVHENKAALQVALQGILPHASIKKMRTQSHLITINKNEAQSELNMVVHLNNDSRYAAAGSLVFVGMKFGYEKIGKKWAIRRMELTSVNNQPMNWGDVP